MLLAPQPQPREMFGCGHPPKNTFTAELWQVVNNFNLIQNKSYRKGSSSAPGQQRGGYLSIMEITVLVVS